MVKSVLQTRFHYRPVGWLSFVIGHLVGALVSIPLKATPGPALSHQHATMGDRDAHKDGARRVASYTLLARCRGRGRFDAYGENCSRNAESLWNNYLALARRLI